MQKVRFVGKEHRGISSLCLATLEGTKLLLTSQFIEMDCIILQHNCQTSPTEFAYANTER
jgi:hypothetical protein